MKSVEVMRKRFNAAALAALLGVGLLAMSFVAASVAPAIAACDENGCNDRPPPPPPSGGR